MTLSVGPLRVKVGGETRGAMAESGHAPRRYSRVRPTVKRRQSTMASGSTYFIGFTGRPFTHTS